MHAEQGLAMLAGKATADDTSQKDSVVSPGPPGGQTGTSDVVASIGPLRARLNVTTPVGVGMVLVVPTRLIGARGRTTHVIVRFTDQDGKPLRADSTGLKYYRDATGKIATSGVPRTIESDDEQFTDRGIFIPYRALNMESRGGAIEYHLRITAYLYVDNFEVARSAVLQVATLF
jgi:hypothetical protein